MKPILFSSAMVNAILDGRKTMTRRIVKQGIVDTFVVDDFGILRGSYKEGMAEPYDTISDAYVGVGDVLWARETWMPETEQGIHTGGYIYKATDRPVPDGDSKLIWHPSIFMPREASRIFLRITDVRVERVNEITASDALKEGSYLNRCACMLTKNDNTPIDKMFKQDWCHIHGDEFKTLWDSINKKRGYGWDKNPWVWVYEFVRISEEEAEKLEVK